MREFEYRDLSVCIATDAAPSGPVNVVRQPIRLNGPLRPSQALMVPVPKVAIRRQRSSHCDFIFYRYAVADKTEMFSFHH
eukprot:scaffold26342_cov54-Attheya_sp.AAC.6